MASLEIDLTPLVASLATTQERLERLDWQRISAAIALILESETKANFDRGVTPDGQVWAPLKRERSRNRGRGASRPLLDTGLLRASYSAQGQHHIQDIRRDGVSFGSSLDYAPYHHEGTRTIPARPALGINDAVMQQIEELVADEIARQIGG